MLFKHFNLIVGLPTFTDFHQLRKLTLPYTASHFNFTLFIQGTVWIPPTSTASKKAMGLLTPRIR